MSEKFKILMTSIGKRIQLINHLKEKFIIIGADADSLIAAKYFADVFYKIPKADQPDYLKFIYEICSREKVKAVIPLYEGEFNILNSARNKLKEIGTELLLSYSEVVGLCKDKKKTDDFFKDLSLINLPRVYSQSEIEEIIRCKKESVMPLFIKPVSGMGSMNSFKINSVKELAFFKDYVNDNIIEEFINGDEFTVDCLVDFNGNPIYIIPRKRIEVHAGEVVKTCTVHDDSLINNTQKV
ncbi:ATP-grasp domain-containing protein, partial [uncultured Clostridium sp.]|uniref:ATP-grasp domain-containing protein n=1 Tax=uncultured Clostridium sp. TaxID=59620 RepID=UPI0025CF7084